MRHRGRVIGATAILLALLSILAAGCGGSSDAAARHGNLTWFMWSGSQDEVAAWKHVAAMVTEEYPGIHVRFQTTSFDDYFTKLITRAASHSLPCLISMQAQRAEGIGSLFQPLDDRIAASNVRPGDFDPAILKGLRYDSHQRALPYDLGPYVLYYNKTMFDRVGVPEPDPDWTMRDFMAAARKLTGHGTYGFVTDAYPDRWFPFALNRGADYRRNGRLDLTDDKLVDAFRWTTGLVSKEKVAAPVPATSAGTWALDQWHSGNAAMVVDGPWDLINTKQNVDFEFGIVPVPAGRGGQVSLTSGSGFGISRDCANPEAAWKAVQVMTSPKAERYLADQGRAFPARTAQQKYWYAHAVPGAKRSLNAALAHARPFRTTSGWDHTSALLRQYGVEAFSGARTPREVLETVQSQVAP